MCQTIWSQLKLLSFTRGHRGLGEACPWWQDWLLKAWDGEINKSCSFLWILSSCGLQNLAAESPVVSRMKGSGLPLCLLSAVFYVFWTPSARLKTLHLGSCVITASLQAIRSGFSEIQDRVLCEGGTPPFTLWLPPHFSTYFSLSPSSRITKRGRLGTPYQEDVFPGSICSS